MHKLNTTFSHINEEKQITDTLIFFSSNGVFIKSQNSTHCPSNSSKMKTISWHSSKPTINSRTPPKYQSSFFLLANYETNQTHNPHNITQPPRAKNAHTWPQSATNVVSPSQEKNMYKNAPAKDLLMISATSLTLKNGKERRLSRRFPHPIKHSNIRASVKFAVS